MSGNNSHKSSEQGIVRLDLLQKSSLLAALGKLIRVIRPEGQLSSIVISAPHHAAHTSIFVSGHDKETGRIAEFIAEELKAKCVIVDELRTFIDINKDPLESLSQYSAEGARAAKHMRLFYQSQVFQGIPRLIIEIHGHVKGNYDLEISSGSELSSDVAQDTPALEGLKRLREALARSLHGTDITAGVFPLDRDVYYQAKMTYTFLRIERLRELGLPISGLHIEIHKRLRELIYTQEESGARPPEFVKALVGAIQAYLKSEKILGKKELDRKSVLLDLFPDSPIFESFKLLRDKPFFVQMAPKDFVKKDVILLSHKDLAALQVTEGERIWVSSNKLGQGAVEVESLSSERVPGTASLAKRLRLKLGVEKGEGIFLGRMSRKSGAKDNVQDIFYVHDIIEAPASEQVTIFLSPQTFDRFIKAGPQHNIVLLQMANSSELIEGRIGCSRVYGGGAEFDKGITISKELAYPVGLIVGDLVMLHFGREKNVQISKFE